ncbi:MAG: Signal-transduction histidine kinase senX3, partial [Bacteroidota bacterium]
MKNNKLNISIILGFIAIVGILITQLLWTKKAFSIEEKKFSQKTHIALLEVAKKLYEGINHELPLENPVKKIANDYYIVNIENDFDPKVLEFYLRTEFQKFNLLTDFEYAIYNCQSDEMIYGGSISFDNIKSDGKKIYFPKHKNFVYYFAIRFPEQNSFLFESLTFWVFLSAVLMLVLLLYCYSIYTLLQYRKYADLQRDFVNNMAHEFKTPLSSILIAGNFLSRQQHIALDEKALKYSQIIVNQGIKLNQQIEKILNLSKSDSNSFKLYLENFLITDATVDAIDNILLKYANAKIFINNEKLSKDIFIKADRFHFVNIVYNLLENAIKY